jgi:teichuronic acid exporter
MVPMLNIEKALIDESLENKTLHGFVWSFIEAIGMRGMQFVVGIVLARLLLPEQFGLIGMVSIFIAVCQSLVDSGFGLALIQKQEMTQTDISSIFYFNLLLGLIAAFVLWIAAPWIAAFYKQPVLIPLVRALTITIVINSFGMMQNTVLTKEIKFKTIAIVSLIASMSSGIIGIFLALRGFGVWSLAIQQIFAVFVSTFSLWLFNPWRPALLFSFDSLRNLFGYGSRMLASGLLNQVFNNLYFVVIGKWFSAIDLGYFGRAKILVDLPTHTLSGIVGRVIFPVLTIIQEDRERVKQTLKKIIAILMFVNFPLMIGLAVCARPFVLAVLTEKWIDCVQYLQLICLSGLLLPLEMMNSTVLKALGRANSVLMINVVHKVMVIINILIAVFFGISAMIYGLIATSIISYCLNAFFAGIIIEYPFREQIRDMCGYLSLTLLMGAMVVKFSVILTFNSHWCTLFVQTAFGGILYLCMCRMFRMKGFMGLYKIIYELIPK